MIISQQDRDNYTKLCALHNELYQSLGRCKTVVNDEQVFTVLYQAAKRLVGRKDMLWLDHEGRIQPKENALIKLSFTGFMRRERWGRTWRRIGEYEMWNYIFREGLIAGLKQIPTKRNPTAFQDLICILEDGSKLKEHKSQGLEIKTKITLPKVIDIQEGLSSDSVHKELVMSFKVTEFKLLSSVNWNTSIKLQCISPDGECHQIDDFIRQEVFLRFSEHEVLEPIFFLLQEGKKYVDEQYEKRMEPQREFNKKYGQYLVAKEL